MIHPVAYSIAHPRHAGWATRAAVSGFLASVAALLLLVLAYSVAAAVGSSNSDAGVAAAWAQALTTNHATAMMTHRPLLTLVGAHVAVGLVWAVIYGALVEPALRGPGWRKGLLFAPLPGLLSLFVVLPLVGVGPLGVAAGAGPLPALGVVLLHAVYGLTLGTTYGLADGAGAPNRVGSARATAVTRMERDMALGLALGAGAGALAGLVPTMVGLGVAGLDAPVLIAIGGAGAGALAGLMIGTFVGLITSR